MISKEDPAPRLLFVCAPVVCRLCPISSNEKTTHFLRPCPWFVAGIFRALRPNRAQMRPFRCAQCSSDPVPSYSVQSEDDSGDFATVLQFGIAGSQEGGPTVADRAKDGPLETPWLCKACKNTGFVPCLKCGASGIVKRSQTANAFFCEDCCGKKKLRCPECGGKCYMCE